MLKEILTFRRSLNNTAKIVLTSRRYVFVHASLFCIMIVTFGCSKLLGYIKHSLKRSVSRAPELKYFFREIDTCKPIPCQMTEFGKIPVQQLYRSLEKQMNSYVPHCFAFSGRHLPIKWSRKLSGYIFWYGALKLNDFSDLSHARVESKMMLVISNFHQNHSLIFMLTGKIRSG